MDRSFREQGSGTQKAPKSFLAGLKVLVTFVQGLAGFMLLTEEQQEEAGIHHGRPRGQYIPVSLRTFHIDRN